MKALTHGEVYEAVRRETTIWSNDPLFTFLNAHRETIAREVYELRKAYADLDAVTLYVPVRFFGREPRNMTIWGLKVELADVPTLIIGREVAL